MSEVIPENSFTASKPIRPIGLIIVTLPFVGLVIYWAKQEDMGYSPLILGIIIIIITAIVAYGIKVSNENNAMPDDMKAEEENAPKISIPDKVDSCSVALKMALSLNEDPSIPLRAILGMLKKRRTKACMIEALDSEVYKEVIDYAMHASPDSKVAFPICGDILVELFSGTHMLNNEKMTLIRTKMECRNIAELLLGLLKTQLEKLRALQDGGDAYRSSAYKIIVALGSLCTSAIQDESNAQTIICDLGAVQVLMDYFKMFETDYNMFKWICWCLIHITFEHPANKVEFVRLGGVEEVVHRLQKYVDTYVKPINTSKNLIAGPEYSKQAITTILFQALGLLCNTIMPDSNAKMSLAKLQHNILQLGIVDICQEIQKSRELREDAQLSDVISSISEIVMINYS